MKDMLKQIQLLVLPIVWNACETWCQMVVHNFLLKNSKGGLTTRTPSNQKVEEKMNIIISWDGCSQIIGKW